MSMGQHQQLHELQKEAGLIKGKKMPESGRALEVEWLHTKQKQIIVEMRAYLQMKSPKLTTEIIKSFTERGAEPDRTMQTLDSQGH